MAGRVDDELRRVIESYELTKSEIEDILMHEVAAVAVEILQRHIIEDVYDMWTPTHYLRRYSLTENIKWKIDDDGMLLVTSVAEPSPPHTGWHSSGDGAFLYAIEQGNMGWWRQRFPRPAISLAQREVDHSVAIERAIDAGVKRVMNKK